MTSGLRCLPRLRAHFGESASRQRQDIVGASSRGKRSEVVPKSSFRCACQARVIGDGDQSNKLEPENNEKRDMAQFPNNPQQFDPHQGMARTPAQPRRRWRFRWGWWVGLPLACLGAAWFLKGVEVAFEWEDIMRWLGVRNFDRFTRLCCLGLGLICICAVCRVLKRSGRDGW